VAAGLAAGFAVAAYLVANGIEYFILRVIRPSLPDLVELSDFILSGAAGVTLYLWLHLKSTRAELLRLEREQIVVHTQLATAGEIQRHLLPREPPALDTLSTAVRFEPAWEIGGDFYDFISLGRDAMLVTIGDISGKGIPAAMLVAFARTVLRTHVNVTTEPADLLAQLSRVLYADNGGSPYATCIVARVDARQGIVTYANAGHPPGIIVGHSGVHFLDEAGPPAGMFPDTDYASETLPLRPCDLMIMMTDGITERVGNGSPASSIADLVYSSPIPRTASTVCNRIMSYARSAPGPSGAEDLADDRTVVACQSLRATPGLEQDCEVHDDVRP
jgi:stage II sporulation SpoE-like protein